MSDPDFFYAVIGGILVLVGALLLLARLYPGSGSDVLDWKPTRSIELEAELELVDIEQMLEAQNERRRRRGEAERLLEDVELDVALDLQVQREARVRGRESAEGPEDSPQWPGS